MESIKEFYLTGEGFSESRLYEMKMLCREFFPGADIRQDPCDCNLIWKDGVWTLTEKNGRILRTKAAGRTDAFGNLGGDLEKNREKVGLYSLLKEQTGKEIPWGILTGVRPTKMVYEGLEHGLAPDEIKKTLETGFLLRKDKANLAVEVAQRERDLLQNHRGTDLDLYVGIPFCPSRCAYCSFVSYDFHTLGDVMERYTTALEREIRSCRSMRGKRRLRSFYMGGGTPTALTPDQLERVLYAVQESFGFENLTEATVEAGRPDTIDKEHLQVLQRFGIGRISVNPQTMNQETLVRIGRRHTVEDTRRAFALAGGGGNYSLPPLFARARARAGESSGGGGAGFRGGRGRMRFCGRIDLGALPRCAAGQGRGTQTGVGKGVREERKRRGGLRLR